MSLPARITSLLTSLTKDQLLGMPAVERQKLSDECERVHRIIKTEMILADAQDETAESGVLTDLRDGRGRQ